MRPEVSDRLRPIVERVRGAVAGAAHRVADAAEPGRPKPPELHECEAYPGYSQADVERLELLRSPEPAAGRPGYVTDFIGGRLAVDMVPGAERFDGQTLADLPVPSDRLHAETAEYVALALAFEHADPERFQLVELGAGWAPWMVAAGIVAVRRGASAVRLIGIEADDRHLEYAFRNLTDNGLRPDGREPKTTFGPVECELHHGAIWWEDGTVHFPADGDSMDYGLAAGEHAGGVDYRGVALEQRPVRAFGLSALLDGNGLVDLLHVDIQGSEADVLGRSIETLDRTVRVICVGTHSRTIEGELVTMFRDAGWSLHDEKPCRFSFDGSRPSLEGMTTSDGVQIWLNTTLLGADRA